MAHKGYTLNYFLDFFRNTTPGEWVCGTERDEDCKGNAKFCAIGFAGAYDEDGSATTKAREAALLSLIPEIVDVNDATSSTDTYNSLGKTPRARVLKAIQLRKKLGTNWNEDLE